MTRPQSPERMTPPLRAALTQAGATALAALPVVAGLEMTIAQWALVQGAIAMRIAGRWAPDVIETLSPYIAYASFAGILFVAGYTIYSGIDFARANWRTLNLGNV